MRLEGWPRVSAEFSEETFVFPALGPRLRGDERHTSCSSIHIMTDIPESAALAREMYSEGVTTREILEATGFSHWMLYRWIAGGPTNRDGEPLLPPLPKRRTVTRRRILKEERLKLVNRMMRAAERQVGEIEERLTEGGQALGERERDARTLALLAKTLQSLTALDALHEPKTTGARKKRVVDEDDEDTIPADIDAIRRELSRSLEAMAAGGARDIPGETE